MLVCACGSSSGRMQGHLPLQYCRESFDLWLICCCCCCCCSATVVLARLFASFVLLYVWGFGSFVINLPGQVI